MDSKRLQLIREWYSRHRNDYDPRSSLLFGELLTAVEAAVEPVVQQCQDGWHRSTSSGYGPQRCERCGHEWVFESPVVPRRAAGEP